MDKEYLYYEHRQRLVEGLHQQCDSFDKTLITLSTAAIAFSVLVIKEIFPDPVFWTIMVLAFSWIAFAACALLVLLSFLSSQSCYEKLIQEWDAARMPGKHDSTRSSELDKRTKTLSRLGIYFFVIGIVLVGVFVLTNLWR